MGWWEEIFRKKAEDWIFEPLAPAQVPDNLQHAAVQKESSYLSVYLKSARIVNVRQGLSKFYGVVNSFISVPYLSGTNAEFNVITTPAFLKNVDSAHIDRVIQLDQRLLGRFLTGEGNWLWKLACFPSNQWIWRLPISKSWKPCPNRLA